MHRFNQEKFRVSLGRWTLAAITSVCVLTACGGGGESSPPASNASALVPNKNKERVTEKDHQCSVDFWGDSISGLTAPRLGDGLNVHLHAVYGGTAEAALPTFLQNPLRARFVVLEYGTNDSNAQKLVESPMRTMLERIKAVGRTPVVVGLSGATQGDMTYRAVNNAKAQELAVEYGALFVDWAAVPWSPPDLNADGIHPADPYQQRLADLLLKTIVDASPDCVG